MSPGRCAGTTGGSCSTWNREGEGARSPGNGSGCLRRSESGTRLRTRRTRVAARAAGELRCGPLPRIRGIRVAVAASGEARSGPLLWAGSGCHGEARSGPRRRTRRIRVAARAAGELRCGPLPLAGRGFRGRVAEQPASADSANPSGREGRGRVTVRPASVGGVGAPARQWMPYEGRGAARKRRRGRGGRRLRAASRSAVRAAPTHWRPCHGRGRRTGRCRASPTGGPFARQWMPNARRGAACFCGLGESEWPSGPSARRGAALLLRTGSECPCERRGAARFRRRGRGVRAPVDAVCVARGDTHTLAGSGRAAPSSGFAQPSSSGTDTLAAVSRTGRRPGRSRASPTGGPSARQWMPNARRVAALLLRAWSGSPRKRRVAALFRGLGESEWQWMPRARCGAARFRGHLTPEPFGLDPSHPAGRPLRGPPLDARGLEHAGSRERESE